MSKLSTLISPKLRIQIAQDRWDTLRLYHLKDLWLSSALLQLSRAARNALPELSSDPDRQTYNTTLLWEIVPTLARSLAPNMKLESGERVSIELANLSPTEKRDHLYHYLKNTNLEIYGYSNRLGDEFVSQKRALRMLGRDMANGNPICLAIDRLYPPVNTDDSLSRAMASISRARGHDPIQLSWSPEFQTMRTLYNEKNDVSIEEDISLEASINDGKSDIFGHIPS